MRKDADVDRMMVSIMMGPVAPRRGPPGGPPEAHSSQTYALLGGLRG